MLDSQCPLAAPEARHCRSLPLPARRFLPPPPRPAACPQSPRQPPAMDPGGDAKAAKPKDPRLEALKEECLKLYREPPYLENHEAQGWMGSGLLCEGEPQEGGGEVPGHPKTIHQIGVDASRWMGIPEPPWVVGWRGCWSVQVGRPWMGPPAWGGGRAAPTHAWRGLHHWGVPLVRQEDPERDGEPGVPRAGGRGRQAPRLGADAAPPPGRGHARGGWGDTALPWEPQSVATPRLTTV